MPKILVVDDDVKIQAILKKLFSGRNNTILFSALSIEEARLIFNQNPDIDLIVMDACVPGDTPNTIPLVQELREKYNGLIVASSSVDFYRKVLLKAGCNKEVPKSHLVNFLKEYLSS